MLPTYLKQLVFCHHRRYLLHTATFVLLELLLQYHHFDVRLETTLLPLLYHSRTVRVHHEVLAVIGTIPMSIHPTVAETIVDVLPILREVVVGDGILVTELVL